MRTLHDWFASYSADHQNPTNIGLHWVCVPIILWSVIAALWTIPVHAAIGRAGLWALPPMLAAFLFYYRLSRAMGLAMALVFIASALLAEGMYRALGQRQLLIFAASLFVGAWLGQFIGHKIEGRKPSFLTDLAYLLIGPAWLASKVMRRLGISR